MVSIFVDKYRENKQLFLFSGDWKIFNGNEIGALLGWWQFKVHTELLSKEIPRKNLYFIASTVSSKMLESISKVEGVSFEVCVPIKMYTLNYLIEYHYSRLNHEI